jgi:hypothetical protein
MRASTWPSASRSKGRARFADAVGRARFADAVGRARCAHAVGRARLRSHGRAAGPRSLCSRGRVVTLRAVSGKARPFWGYRFPEFPGQTSLAFGELRPGRRVSVWRSLSRRSARKRAMAGVHHAALIRQWGKSSLTQSQRATCPGTRYPRDRAGSFASGKKPAMTKISHRRPAGMPLV